MVLLTLRHAVHIPEAGLPKRTAPLQAHVSHSPAHFCTGGAAQALVTTPTGDGDGGAGVGGCGRGVGGAGVGAGGLVPPDETAPLT